MSSESTKLYYNPNQDEGLQQDTAWKPPAWLAILILLLVRLSSAVWGLVSNFDEVYNNWEPLHLFLYGKGFQTLDYSSTVAGRCYAFIALHYFPTYIFAHYALYSKMVVFIMVRSLYGVFCIGGEYYAYLAICKKIGIAAGRYFLIFTLCSAGVYQASTSFSVYGFSMICLFYFLGSYLNENWGFNCWCICLSVFFGWPFTVALSLPFCVRFLLSRCEHLGVVSLTIIIPVLQTIMNYFFYKESVLVPLNYIKRFLKVVSGDLAFEKLTGFTVPVFDLESAKFYLNDLFLNWNIAMILACFGFPLCVAYMREAYELTNASWILYIINAFNPKATTFGRLGSLLLLASSTVLWLIFFASQPLTNTSFIVPIYPFVAFFAALACDAISRKWSNVSWGRFNLSSFLVLTFVVLSMSRMYSLHSNFGAQTDVYTALHHDILVQNDFDRFNNPIRLCLGKEWHRYPSSFFLPQQVYDDNARPSKVEMQFIYSGNNESYILPRRIEMAGGITTIKEHDAPIEIWLENKSRYVNLDSCDYIIDVDSNETEDQKFRDMPNKWEPVYSQPYKYYSLLDKPEVDSSSFYIPFISQQPVTTCTLYRKVM